MGVTAVGMTGGMDSAATGQLFECDSVPEFEKVLDRKPHVHYKTSIYWRNLLVLAYFHIASLYGLKLAVTSAHWNTLLFSFFLYLISKIGITAGVHRLWTHKSYKANLRLRAILMFFFTLSFEGRVFVWARDHRIHHKFQETDADPYNASRGFWFSHMGWLMMSKHPDVIEKGRGIDLSDLKADPLVMFQKKYYWQLVVLICFLWPAATCHYGWGESWTNCWYVAICLRYVISFNMTWLVNSVAHLYGNQPYDISIFARENRSVSIVTLGEGWHNYHHVFPWDYKTSEMPTYTFNMTTAFIDAFAHIGWAYDLKTVTPELVAKRAARTGDGTRNRKDVWGWGDKDMPKTDREGAQIINKKDKD